MMARALRAGFALFPCVFSCAQTAPAVASAPGPRAIAAIHAHKCGACHAPPEPHTRARDHLEAAFARHKSRVHLTVQEWAGLTDYLAASGAADLQAR